MRSNKTRPIQMTWVSFTFCKKSSKITSITFPRLTFTTTIRLSTQHWQQCFKDKKIIPASLCIMGNQCIPASPCTNGNQIIQARTCINGNQLIPARTCIKGQVPHISARTHVPVHPRIKVSRFNSGDHRSTNYTVALIYLSAVWERSKRKEWELRKLNKLFVWVRYIFQYQITNW